MKVGELECTINSMAMSCDNVADNQDKTAITPFYDVIDAFSLRSEVVTDMAYLE